MIKYFYVGTDNKAYGPIEPTLFRQNGLTTSTLVCPEGGKEWVPLTSIPGLVNYLNLPPSPQPTYQYCQPNNFGGYNQPINNRNYGHPGYPPSSYMALAILVTIFCCLPFGVVAIVKASQVSNLWMSGNYDAAYRSSRSARNWCIASACCSLGAVIIYLLSFAALFV